MSHTNSDITVVHLSKTRRWASLIVLSASLLIITMDMTILNVALPQITAELQPTSEQLLWMVDAYSLALAGLLVTMSGLGDRFGRKRILIIGYFLFGIASASAFFAYSTSFVITLRVILGVGGAMIMPATLSMLRSVFPDPKERATAIAVWAAVSMLGSAIGPIVGGFLLEHFTWHAAFLVNVPFMIAAITGAFFILPEVRLINPGRWDFVGTILSICGMVLLPWSIKRFAQEQSITDPLALLGFVAALVFLALFVRHCLRRPDPLLDIKLFKRRAFTGGILAACGSMLAMAAMMYLLAQWMQLVQGYSPIETGFHMIPMAASGLVGALIAPTCARKLGARRAVSFGLGLMGFGILFIWMNGSDLHYFHVFVTMISIGIGGSALTVGSAMIMSCTPPERAGNAAALEETSYDIGNVFGVALIGSIAALVYKTDLDLSSLSSLDPELAQAAQESIGAAIEIAEQANLPELANQATAAFSHSLAVASLVGGILLISVALSTYFIIPKDTDIDTQSH